MLYFVPSMDLYDAACRDIPEEDKKLFFTNSSKAKKICRGCTVKEACLAKALSFGAHGIWGGTTDTERQLLKNG